TNYGIEASELTRSGGEIGFEYPVIETKHEAGNAQSPAQYLAPLTKQVGIKGEDHQHDKADVNGPNDLTRQRAKRRCIDLKAGKCDSNPENGARQRLGLKLWGERAGGRGCHQTRAIVLVENA